MRVCVFFFAGFAHPSPITTLCLNLSPLPSPHLHSEAGQSQRGVFVVRDAQPHHLMGYAGYTCKIESGPTQVAERNRCKKEAVEIRMPSALRVVLIIVLFSSSFPSTSLLFSLSHHSYSPFLFLLSSLFVSSSPHLGGVPVPDPEAQLGVVQFVAGRVQRKLEGHLLRGGKEWEREKWGVWKRMKSIKNELRHRTPVITVAMQTLPCDTTPSVSPPCKHYPVILLPPYPHHANTTL